VGFGLYPTPLVESMRAAAAAMLAINLPPVEKDAPGSPAAETEVAPLPR
jgi:hypothetical protein